MKLDLPQITDKTNFVHYLDGLAGSSRALAFAKLAEQREQPIVVISDDTPALWQLQKEIQYFLGKDSDIPVMVFPDWETLPYDNFSPHQDIVSERLLTLYNLPRLKHGIVLIAVNTLLLRLPPQEYIEQNSLIVHTGQKLDMHEVRKLFEESGYHSVNQVFSHGEYAVRGSILDVFPMGSEKPLRLDFFDDEIDSIRYFDPESQLSDEKIQKFELLPAKEFPLDEEGIATFRQNFRAEFEVNLQRVWLYQEVSNGNSPAGIEYYLPLFFTQLDTFFDYLPQQSLICTLGDHQLHAEHYWDEITERYEQRRHDIERPILEPKKLYLAADELNSQLKQHIRIHIKQERPDADYQASPMPMMAIDHKAKDPVNQFRNFLKQWTGQCFIATESPGRREALKDLLGRNEIQASVVEHWSEASDAKNLVIGVAPLSKGFALSDLAVVTETELFGEHVIKTRRRDTKAADQAEDMIRNLAELKEGDPVVHIEQGIGRYRGLVKLESGDIEAEYLMIEYAGGDKLYMPVQSLHLIGRYSGTNPELAPWHKLGTEQWDKARQKAAEKARDVAAELLDIYARRAAKEGIQYQLDETEYRRFCAEFAFEETVDQTTAINAVIRDMTSPLPMDRLVCGDVGFGKTEVALRAAFIAAQSGKQVAVLVPTTLLAQQHFETFSDRFADWPMKVASLSRFATNKEVQATLKGLEDGTVDIVVGTHKLIQQDVKFKRLGLLIIDEEHRFGVRQKEQLKKFRTEVDILTLTATPIPRTLNMSMSGMRDLSIIATPPARRLSVKTFVREYHKPLIREAVLREILRGGQVYFLHNAVDTIQRTLEELQELLPEARIQLAHGQMRERELEQVMRDFYHQRFNVLVCTTIVETGIDNPNANTMIIDRADKFGLAQLHQLRGRVGRSHHQAYAYLLTPAGRKITKDAEKRLEAIASLEDLGAGFTLATHDLEIRGAGELLGDEQSGQMQAVGFNLYMDMLEDAVKALKEGKEPSLQQSLKQKTEIDLSVPALIPDDYIGDVATRLSLYKRIANAKTKEQLDALQVEFIDRFGLLPEALKNLFTLTELALRVQPLGISKIDLVKTGIRIRFVQDTQIDPGKLIRLIQLNPSRYRFEQNVILKILTEEEEIAPLVKEINTVIEKVS
ncbi:transcription-repair coupling factor [Kangiella profundi]|uniref:Transcription-repair-coupling factor n=1 Tax=Kangiella profundi TaxID=1561924 RepID=A0A2K9AIG5_9GAMM|nr:transcription-repair coupling factor [Kangiella profundi]AUD78724.1 transcription-repair coupling factor [Kangiella profundi]GGE89987.1 transcription-repair-coupling factor [Kangiella profundi]